VQPGSYAARFLRPGDMLVAINGDNFKSVAELKGRIAKGVTSLSLAREGTLSTIQFR
jgi:hypothetical protein